MVVDFDGSLCRGGFRDRAPLFSRIIVNSLSFAAGARRLVVARLWCHVVLQSLFALIVVCVFRQLLTLVFVEGGLLDGVLIEGLFWASEVEG
jgi:hypothetical protein